MRKLLLIVWLLIPVAAGAYHLGPGQERMTLDQTAELIDKAEAHAKAGEHEDAAKAYEDALTLLPSRLAETAQKLRLERAKSQMLAKQLPDARAELESLLNELEAAEKPNPKLLEETRSPAADALALAIWSDKSRIDACEIEKLHAKVGQLTMENDFLSKLLGRDR